MSDQGTSNLPDGLSDAGSRLYEDVLGWVADDWELDARDLVVLEMAARTADTIAVLEAELSQAGPLAVSTRGTEKMHPAVVEIRLQRLALEALLRRVELESPQVRTGRMTKRQRDQLADARRARLAK